MSPECCFYTVFIAKKSRSSHVEFAVLMCRFQFSAMASQYQDRQDSKLYGSRLIIHRRVDLDNNNFYFRAKVSGHTGYIRRSCQTPDPARAMLLAEQAYEELLVRAKGGFALKTVTVDAFFEGWIEATKHRLTETRYKWKKSVYAGYVSGHFGKKNISDLTKKQTDQLIWYVGTLRHPLRNEVIVMLSVKAGLRAKEIASLTWSMITDADGDIVSSIHLTDKASKGRGGRIIPLNMQLRLNLADLLEQERQHYRFDLATSYMIRTERSEKTSPQAVVNMFASWFDDTGLIGCSSHSGRRTFITNAAKKISSVGGSLRDVQMLAGHSSLAVTQRYIEGDGEARIKVVELV